MNNSKLCVVICKTVEKFLVYSLIYKYNMGSLIVRYPVYTGRVRNSRSFEPDTKEDKTWRGQVKAKREIKRSLFFRVKEGVQYFA